MVTYTWRRRTSPNPNISFACYTARVPIRVSLLPVTVRVAIRVLSVSNCVLQELVASPFWLCAFPFAAIRVYIYIYVLKTTIENVTSPGFHSRVTGCIYDGDCKFAVRGMRPIWCVACSHAQAHGQCVGYYQMQLTSKCRNGTYPGV